MNTKDFLFVILNGESLTVKLKESKTGLSKEVYETACARCCDTVQPLSTLFWKKID